MSVKQIFFFFQFCFWVIIWHLIKSPSYNIIQPKFKFKLSSNDVQQLVFCLIRSAQFKVNQTYFVCTEHLYTYLHLSTTENFLSFLFLITLLLVIQTCNETLYTLMYLSPKYMRLSHLSGVAREGAGSGSNPTPSPQPPSPRSFHSNLCRYYCFK